MKIRLMYFLVDSPPCLNIIFINNINVYLQCNKSCIFSMVSLIFSYSINLLFREDNFILNFFLWKKTRIDNCFFVFIVSICTWLFSYVPSINSITHPFNYFFLNLAVRKLYLHLQVFHWPLMSHIDLPVLMLLGFYNSFHH